MTYSHFSRVSTLCTLWMPLGASLREHDLSRRRRRKTISQATHKADRPRLFPIYSVFTITEFPSPRITPVGSPQNLLRGINSSLMPDRPLLSLSARLTRDPPPRLARQPRQAMPLRANCVADKSVVSRSIFLFCERRPECMQSI